MNRRSGGISAVVSRMRWERRFAMVALLAAGSVLALLAFISAAGSASTEPPASRATIANRRSHRILETTAEMPPERLFILVVAVHREVVDTGQETPRHETPG